MNRTIFTRPRILMVIVILFLALLCLNLFRLQMVEAKDANSMYKTGNLTYTIPVKAARGEILDCYGRVLVQNKTSYTILFTKMSWDNENQNVVILRLIDIMNSYHAIYIDTLPVSLSPYKYTYENDSQSKSELQDFVSQQKWPKNLTARQLMQKLYERYNLNKKGYSEDQKRVIAGVRYEMEIREFSRTIPFTFAQDVSSELVAVVKENSYMFPGVETYTEPMRVYSTTYAAHILGRIGKIYKDEYQDLKKLGYRMDAMVGKDGVEKAFESYLRGTDGVRSVIMDTQGRITGEMYETDPKPGNNVFLTIDLQLQEVAESALADRITMIKKLSAKNSKKYPSDIGGGSVVVMNVKTGAVLAMASWPTYNLATFSQDYNALLTNKLKPMINRAIGAAYPPASVFKVITATGALQKGAITLNTVVRDTGIYKYYKDYQPHCWIYNEYGHGHGNENVITAIRDSCNYFFFDAGRRLGITKLDNYAKSFGLGQYTGIELSGEVTGMRSNPETKKRLTDTAWYPGDTLQTAIGQSYTAVTPLQMVTYISAIANGGTLYTPYIMKSVTNYDYTETLLETKPVVKNKIDISQSTRQAILKGMEQVTENGTASSVFKHYPVKIAGKTGSAQVPNGSDNGVFAAFGPVDDPQIAVVVIVEHAGTGNSIAPIAKAVFDAYFKLDRGVKSTESEDNLLG